ncbi:MAG: DUF4105 domain-containing protein [Marinobacter sp.]|nr:DUF4105 domain-containing protein [Marinobacter sp.]
MLSTKRLWSALLWLTLSPCAFAISTQQIKTLATDPVWLALGHYRPDTFGGTYTSQADDVGFFISPQGKHSPRAELIATLIAIQQPGGGDSNARCRFPARDRWLRSKLELPANPVACTAYQSWRQDLNTESVTLVFAASYLNSPSSMFGHTFLRLDPPSDDQDTNLLLASTISYAADAAAHDSELLFAYRGIFGGYPGITSIQPYYEKIRQYSDIENRDLWEYRLNLTPDEVDWMLAHAWEIHDINFDYYFFDENCAYRLLALIDVARPGTNLLDKVTTHAIPSDTVRWVVDKGLVSNVHYRPSAFTRVRYALDELPPHDRDLAGAIADGYVAVEAPDVTDLAPQRRAHLLDATYDYVRYQADAEGWPRDYAAPLSHALLAARSQIDDSSPPPSPPTPAIRDDQGHDTMRIGLTGGREAGRSYAQLTVRPAYHDELDPPGGYRPGAQLQFLRLDARYYTDNDSLDLQQLTAVNIRSLTPRDSFFTPWSWQVGVGARRTEAADGDHPLAPYLAGGVGGSWLAPGRIQAISLLTADVEVDNDLTKGYDVAPGLDLGLLHQSSTLSLMGGIRSKLWLAGGEHREDELYLNGSLHLSQALSLTADFNRTSYYDRIGNQWQIGFNVYF